MSRRDFLAKVALVAALLALAGCGWFAERWEWNQKLTVEVLVDGETVSGAAVSYVRWQEANALDHYPTAYRGEATVVDLGERGLLFALIGEPTKYIAGYTLHEELGERRSDYETLYPKIASFRGVREVAREAYPLLVTFTDIADPATVRRVDPDDLVDTFGPGVALKRVTLEITDEAVTEGEVEAVLRWLGEYPETPLGRSPDSFAPVFAATVNNGNFVRR
ncbi:twin-arginine translocation signal domain-containing protein [Nitratireductor alexandrii]|uniref:twin-arginine translocation signal domain-containing protein n=1 Tax=Nitratireductor alexandrii TaxID=2448161 RepID=UPI0023AA2E70|nr:twin-arginine translocation signal domain-containing protein [Nitratireductor alexandrii]